MAFKFVDLFAGIGGFHAALGAMGGRCVYASEWDEDVARIYERNWNLEPDGDLTLAANDTVMKVPSHDVLAGGFPCQPFSKSGKQLGMEETRGTLFWNIAKIIEVRKPTLVLLENVRNIAGPRHLHEWEVIIKTLRNFGYRVSSKPLVVSPHLIRPEFGGRPQVRNRVFIAATRIPSGSNNFAIDIELPNLSSVTSGWDPNSWDLAKDLPLEKVTDTRLKKVLSLSDNERLWIDAWNDFVLLFRNKKIKGQIPGFPFWVDNWIDKKNLFIPEGTPDWKKNYLNKNSEFYTQNKKILDAWLKEWMLFDSFPPSRRKFEWQAQDSNTLWDTILHFRPSGIRAKKPTYVPALVAITQTSIVGKQKRRISVREGARLQGLPDWFDFADQPDSISYKQLGNSVNVGSAYHVMRALVLRDIDLLAKHTDLVRDILGSPMSPDINLDSHKVFHSYVSPKHFTFPEEYGQLKLIK